MLNNLKKLRNTLYKLKIKSFRLDNLIKYANEEIKVGDFVQITAGPDNGRRGHVMEVHKDENWVAVKPAPGYDFKKDLMYANYDEVIDVEKYKLRDDYDFQQNQKGDPLKFIKKYAPYLYDLDESKRNTLLNKIHNYIYSQVSSYNKDLNYNHLQDMVPIFKEYPELLNNKIIKFIDLLYYFVRQINTEDQFVNQILDDDFMTNILKSVGECMPCASIIFSDKFSPGDPDRKELFMKAYQKYPTFLDTLADDITNNRPEYFFDLELGELFSSYADKQKYNYYPPDLKSYAEGLAYRIMNTNPIYFLNNNLDSIYPNFRDYEIFTLNKGEGFIQNMSSEERAINNLIYNITDEKKSHLEWYSIYYLAIEGYLENQKLKDKVIYKILELPESVMAKEIEKLISLSKDILEDSMLRNFLESLTYKLLELKQYDIFYSSKLSNVFKDLSMSVAKDLAQQDISLFINLGLGKRDKPTRKYLFTVGDKVFVDNYFWNTPGTIIKYDQNTGDIQVKMDDSEISQPESKKIISTNAWSVSTPEELEEEPDD